jgi:hypothetical protein
MPVVAPETVARQKLQLILQTAFATEQFKVLMDKLSPSIGSNGVRIGISPIVSAPAPNNEKVLNMSILVQFYGKWKQEVNPDSVIDPALIESYAERFREAILNNDPKTNQVWYFRVLSVTYVDDPTGNKTRFEANVLAVGENPAIP